MSGLDLDALEARCKDTIAEWTLVYAQSGETLPDDAVETKAARETLALITRLRAAEARTAWQAIETAPMGEWVAVIDGGLATTGARVLTASGGTGEACGCGPPTGNHSPLHRRRREPQR